MPLDSAIPERDWKEEMHQYLLCFIINLFSSDKESFTETNPTYMYQKAIQVWKKGKDSKQNLGKIL